MKTNNRFLILFAAIFLFAVGDAGAQETTPVSTIEDAYPYWSPDGERIVFYSNRAGVYFQVFVINRDGTGLTQLTFDAADNRTPVFSPDGAKIAWQSERDGNREIYVMEADGTNQTRLTIEPAEDSHPKWSSDGQEIIFDSNRDHADTGFTNLYIMKADGADVRRVTERDETDSYSSLSPDGSKVLFRRITPTGSNSQSGRNSEVFIMNRDGSELVNLSNHGDFDGYPSWSPDGQYVLFASNRDQEDFDEFNIYMIKPDGTGLRQLTETIALTSQVRQMVSPDGRFIVFNRDYPDGHIAIHIMEVGSPVN